MTHSLKQCQHPQEDLTQDESAALYLYSLQWPEGFRNSFYSMFNRALRSENRMNFIAFEPYYLSLHECAEQITTNQRSSVAWCQW